MRLLLVILLLSVPAATFGADRGADEARQLFQEASAHFALGEFPEAAAKFMAAYKLKQDPAFLYNAAQAFRQAGQNERALVLYKSFLQFYPKAPQTEEVKEHVAKLQEVVAAAQRAKTAPPTTTAEPSPKEGAVATPAAQTPAPAVLVEAPRPKTPLHKKWWLWTIVAGSAVVVAGVATGVVLGTQNNDPTRRLPELMPQ
jgi:hypothetical protein